MACILVIDDDAAVREVLQRFLVGAGYAVLEAADGREGIQAYETHHVDLVLLDLFMPEQEGFETMRRLRQHTPGVKIVVISGGGSLRSLDVLALAEAWGAHQVLQKPVRSEDLLQAVHEVLEMP